MSAPSEGPPSHLTLDGQSWEVARVGVAYLEKLMTRPVRHDAHRAPDEPLTRFQVIMKSRASWGTTWIVVKPNGAWDATKDPDGYTKYHSYHVLFCGLANEQRFLTKSQIDALNKASNVSAGGPAQRIENERMLISWNGKSAWVSARTLTEKTPSTLPKGAATPVAAPALGSRDRPNALGNTLPSLLGANFFQTSKCFKVGDASVRTWDGPPPTLQAGTPEQRAEYVARISTPPEASAKPAAKKVRNGFHAAITPRAKTHKEVVQDFVTYITTDPRVPLDTRNFAAAQLAEMQKMHTKRSDAAKFTGHIFTVAGLPPENWSQASAMDYILDATLNGSAADQSAAKLLYQAGSGTFNQIFGGILDA